MSSWKVFERKIAKRFGTRRGAASGEREPPDVLHDEFAIECKYKKEMFSKFLHSAYQQAVASWNNGKKIPIVFITWRYNNIDDSMCCMKTGDFFKLYDELKKLREKEKQK